MKYLEAPNYELITGDSIFLGGGITGCVDWQEEMIQALSKTDLTILNPRRKNFPMNDPDAAEEQITWEFYHLQSASCIMFWFPCETLCPITLFEYGKWITQPTRLFIGCHPDYARLSDVKIQTKLARPEQTVHTDLKSLAEEVIGWA